MSDLLVKTPAGLKCPKEGAPREYITDAATGTPVPDTVYYRRLIEEGSLEQVGTVTASTASTPSTKSTTKEAPSE